MCDPITASVMAGIGPGLDAFGTYDQGQYTKAVSRYNARVKQNQAQDVLTKARTAENDQKQQTAQLKSRQRAVLASRGVEIGEGTALQVQDDTDLIGQINTMRIRQGADDQALALRTEADLIKNQGDAAAKQATLSAVSGLIKAGTQVAGSAAGAGAFDSAPAPSAPRTPSLTSGSNNSVASKWYSYGDRSSRFNLRG